MTGTSLLVPDLVGKQLQLLKDVAPRASQIGVISLGSLAPSPSMKEAEAAAPRHGMKLHRIALREPLALDDLALQLRTPCVDAVLGLANPALDDVRIRIVEIVNVHRLPSVCTLTYWAEAGGPGARLCGRGAAASNMALERTAGSHSLAAAAHRRRSPAAGMLSISLFSAATGQRMAPA